MWKNNNGFSLIEILFAMSITMMLVVTVFPIYNLIQTEQYNLKQSLIIQSTLHDFLLEQLHNNAHQNKVTIQLQNQNVTLEFMKEEGFLKGCANWEDQNNEVHKQCLYGIKE